MERDEQLTGGTELEKGPDETLQEERPVMVRLVKTPFRGGMLTLTNHELVLGEGILGARNVRRYPLKQLARIDIEPSPGDGPIKRNKCLRFVWIDGQVTEVDGIGPIAADRIHYVLSALRRPTMRQYVM
jgi:hypothetical protein